MFGKHKVCGLNSLRTFFNGSALVDLMIFFFSRKAKVKVLLFSEKNVIRFVSNHLLRDFMVVDCTEHFAIDQVMQDYKHNFHT